ncbi:DEAD/DEAH box helicase family protein [Candidatus Phytoplasma sacchari]
MVDRIVKVLEKRNNYFVIASTGSGKTIIFSHILKELLEKK